MNTQTLYQLQSNGPDDLKNVIDWFVDLARIARQDGALKWHPKQLETLLNQVATYAEEHLEHFERCDSEDVTMASIVAANIRIKSEYERLVNSHEFDTREKDLNSVKPTHLLEHQEIKSLTA